MAGEQSIINKRYIIKVDPIINTTDADLFFNKVREILKMDVRWRGFNFEYVGAEQYNDPSNTPKVSDYDIIIALLDRTTKHELLNATESKLQDQPLNDGFGKPIDLNAIEFSYTFFSTPSIVIIDNTNWSDLYTKLGISKQDYEQYVIFHEVGHAIGKKHKSIPDDITKPYPIMYQTTLGLPDVKRFIPYPNESDYQ